MFVSVCHQIKKKKGSLGFHWRGFLCQNSLTNSKGYRNNNFPSAYYPLKLLVSTVPAEKNLF